jgi:F-type H+-transporting ATPase subunit b
LDKLGINLGFLLVQIVNFAIIFIVLRAWVYKPMMRMLEKRKLSIAQGLEDARVAAEARANAEREAEVLIKQAQVKANDVMREANERAESRKREIIAEADAEIARKKSDAEAEIQTERNTILSELRSEVVTLAMAAAQKLVQESLTQERQSALLKEFFSGVRACKVVVLEEAVVSGQAAEVTSALPLTDEEKAAVRKDVLAKLGGSAEITFQVDPKILGGLVVQVGDRVVDGSVLGQLQALRQSL